MTTPKDVVIYYYGGSGGFYALHLLLLNGYYRCVFEGDNQNFTEIMKKQWNIDDVTRWKATETWPDNIKTLNSDITNRVFFVCNPTLDDLEQYPGEPIVVYTDIDTHWDIVNAKKCAAFYGGRDQQFYIQTLLVEPFLNLYENVRGENWPDVNNMEDYHALPSWIKTELAVDFNCNVENFDLKTALMPVTDYAGIQIYDEYNSILNISQKKCVVSLQELIRTSGKILYDMLELPPCPEAEEFTKHYLELHPPHLHKRLTQ